jgi:hypothetical protein
MRNLWCLEKISILPFIISATGIVPQSLFKNLKILDSGKIAVPPGGGGIRIIIIHVFQENNISNSHLTFVAICIPILFHGTLENFIIS